MSKTIRLRADTADSKFDTSKILTGHNPERVTIFLNQWCVFYSKKNNKVEQKTFPNEEEARENYKLLIDGRSKILFSADGKVKD